MKALPFLRGIFLFAVASNLVRSDVIDSSLIVRLNFDAEAVAEVGVRPALLCSSVKPAVNPLSGKLHIPASWRIGPSRLAP